MTKTLVNCLIAGVAMLSLSGCFKSSNALSVNKDGSGTYEIDFMLSAEGVKAFAQGGGDPAKSPIPTKAQLEAKASTLGEGVKLESYEETKDGDSKGYKAVYAFTDINKLKINGDEGMETGETNPSKKQLTFKFTKEGDISKLVITNPNIPESSASKPPAKTTLTPEEEKQFEQMSQAFKGMEIALEVEVDGKIVKTDAENVEESTVTLVDIDFDTALKDPKFKIAMSQPPESSNDMSLVKGIEGVSVETKPTVTIEFQ